MTLARSSALLLAALSFGAIFAADMAAAQQTRPATRALVVKRQSYAVPGNVVPVGRENRYVTESTGRGSAFDSSVQGIRSDLLSPR
jgi:hypothetical protein